MTSDMAFIARRDKGGRDGAATAGAPVGAVRIWLLAVAGLVMMMVLVGGATRLTDSGLSITEWQPITGAVPPLSEAAWQAEFEKYSRIPEYRLVNAGMSLAEFKRIYWWEWGHRFLGRLIGLAFFLPFAMFWAKGWLTGRLKRQGLALLGLGALQGVVGWYMVASGLSERVDVSQYRLALHLGLAALILAGIVWVARDVSAPGVASVDGRPADSFRHVATVLGALLFVQILLGALVAGLDAGLTYATWPLMDGRLVPNGLFVVEPWAINFFENVKTVQFDHRMLAYGILALALFHAVQGRGKGAAGRRALLLLALVGAQAVVGILTLIYQVPIPLALLHQGLAFVVFGFAVLHADANRRGMPIVDRRITQPA